MMKMYTEVIQAAKREVKECKDDMKEIVELKVATDIFQSNSIDELSEMIESLSIHHSDTDSSPESLIEAIKSLKINMDVIQSSFEDAVRQVHAEIEKRTTTPISEFDFFFHSIHKFILFFYLI